MKRAVRTGFFLAFACALAFPARAATYYVIVAGLGGEPDYVQRFTADANDLDRIFKAEGPSAHVTTLTGAQATAVELRQVLATVVQQATADDDFVLILVRQLVVDTTSSSGGAVAALERPGRAVIAATKSGTEKNATVFARYFVEAFQDPSADTDKSGSVSAMEAFTYAARKTADFYDSQKRLATEHAVFNDKGSGDPVREPGEGQGEMLASFTLLRYGNQEQAFNNPAKRALLEQKDSLEQKIDTLKYQKAAMDADDYKKQLTEALVALAKVQEQIDGGGRQ